MNTKRKLLLETVAIAMIYCMFCALHLFFFKKLVEMESLAKYLSALLRVKRIMQIWVMVMEVRLKSSTSTIKSSATGNRDRTGTRTGVAL